jgi:DNA-binding winged helix-turn-helix (wHTH) protein/tetratricopeptide (TPR) repeat protein
MTNGHSTLREFGKCRLDVGKRLLWSDGEPVHLPPKALDLLCLLVENNGTVVTKEEIWNNVWKDAYVEESNLTHHVYVLRKAFKDLGLNELIKTVPRRGYRFKADVYEVPLNEVILERHALTKTLIEIEETSDTVAASSRDAVVATRSYTKKRVLAAAAAALVVVFTAGAVWRFGTSAAAGRSPIRTLAVIPFKPVNASGRNEHLGLSVADSLITRLGNVRSLTVRPTSAVARFEDTNETSIELGRSLQVDAVMEGTVVESSGRLRATMRLLRVADGETIWSGEFENASSDEIAFTRSISTKAADALALDLNSAERAAMDRAFAVNEDAYKLYLKGRYEWNKRTWDGMTNSEKYFRSAIEKDPNFALAYVGLADRLAMTSDPNEAQAHIEHALQLEPDLAEAHASLGFIDTFHKWNWNDAESELRRAVELAPNYGTAHQWLGILLEIEGRYDEALAEMRRAVEIDPTSPNFLADLGQTYYFMHDYEAARDYCRRATSIDPDFKFAHDYLFNIALVTNDQDSLVDEWRAVGMIDAKFPNMSEQQLNLTKGLYDELLAKYKLLTREEFIRKLVDNEHKVPQVGYHNARLLALLGDRQAALDELENGIESRSFGVIFLKADPVFDSIRDDPRFEAMLKRVNL